MVPSFTASRNILRPSSELKCTRSSGSGRRYRDMGRVDCTTGSGADEEEEGEGEDGMEGGEKAAGGVGVMVQEEEGEEDGGGDVGDEIEGTMGEGFVDRDAVIVLNARR